MNGSRKKNSSGITAWEVTMCDARDKHCIETKARIRKKLGGHWNWDTGEWITDDAPVQAEPPQVVARPVAVAGQPDTVDAFLARMDAWLETVTAHA